MTINEKLLAIVREGSQEEAVRAVRELAKRRDPDTVQPLAAILKKNYNRYENRSLIYALIEALGAIGSPEAEQALIKAIESPFYYIKKAALKSLPKVDGDETAVEKMGRVLSDTIPQTVKREAVRAMGTTHSKKAVENLEKTIRREEDPALKKEVVRSLAGTGSREALPILIDYYYTEANGKMKHEIIRALSRIAAESSIEFLLNRLHDPKADIRACAAAALG